MTASRSKIWTAAGVAVLAGGLAACGQEDVVKDEPTPIPATATAPVQPQPSTTTPGAAPIAEDPGETGEGGEGGEGADRRPG